MWHNYLKVALRLLIRNPFFAWINILGLSVGFAVFIILWQYSVSELRSDSFHKDHERIYRLVTHSELHVSDQVHKFTMGFDVPIHTAQMAESIPQIESFTRILNQDGFNAAWIPDHDNKLFFALPGVGDQYFYEDHVAYADPNVFDFFGIPCLRGNASKALDHTNYVALSETIAKKYFGDADPINKVILLNNKIPFEVSGIFKDLPKNTHLEFQIVLPMSRLAKSVNEFKITNYGTPVSYLKIREGADMAALAEAMKYDSKNLSVRLSQENSKMIMQMALQPLNEVAFSHYWGDNFIIKSKTFLAILNAIAVLILGVAWINYINLTLSANLRRNKELAARRTVGARPFDFIKQFLLEAALINVLSILAAFTIIQLSKNALSVFLNFHIYDTFDGTFRAAWIVLIAMSTGILIMGIYPAVSTAKATSRKLISKNTTHPKEISIVGVLSVAQYACAIVLVVSAFVIYNQIEFILGKNIGINRDSIVVIDLPINQDKGYDVALRDFYLELSSDPNTKAFTISNNVVGDRQENSVFIKRPNAPDGIVPDCNGGVDERFIPFYNIKLLAGRNFIPEHPADTAAILLSLQGVKNLGYQSADEIIGRKISVQEKEFSATFIQADVIGVFADYKRNTFLADDASMRKGDKSGIVLMYRDYIVPAHVARKISIQFASDDFGPSMAALKEKYEKYFAGNVFHWYFLDENINNHYSNEKVGRNQIVMFAALVICISCLGVLGMMTQRIVQKTKEIGVRKVLGARLHHIGSILIASLARHLLIAMALGIPLAWYATNNYLSRFSEKISVQWWDYLLPIGMLFTIILFAISYNLIKASATNPVDSLKHE
jgi:putative ABC transport system permease protein